MSRRCRQGIKAQQLVLATFLCRQVPAPKLSPFLSQSQDPFPLYRQKLLPRRGNPKALSLMLQKAQQLKRKSEPEGVPTQESNLIAQPLPQPTEQTPISAPTKGKPRRKRRRKSTLPPGLTGAIFVKAFQDAARKDREAQSPYGENSQGIETHIQARINEWGYASYMQSLHKAFVRASRLAIDYGSFIENVKGEIIIRFVNLEGDKFTPLYTEPLTGHPDLDRHILKFISCLDLPPVPRRLQNAGLATNVGISYDFKKGQGGVLQLVPANEK